MATADELRAALAVAELEEQLVAAKAGDEEPSQELRGQLREARRVYREMRAGYPAGEGEARPDAIEAGAEVQV